MKTIKKSVFFRHHPIKAAATMTATFILLCLIPLLIALADDGFVKSKYIIHATPQLHYEGTDEEGNYIPSEYSDLALTVFDADGNILLEKHFDDLQPEETAYSTRQLVFTTDVKPTKITIEGYYNSKVPTEEYPGGESQWMHYEADFHECTDEEVQSLYQNSMTTYMVYSVKCVNANVKYLAANGEILTCPKAAFLEGELVASNGADGW